MIVVRDNVTVPLTNVTVGDLIPCSMYKFRVAASTNEGNGPFSNFVSANTTIAGEQTFKEKVM